MFFLNSTVITIVLLRFQINTTYQQIKTMQVQRQNLRTMDGMEMELVKEVRELKKRHTPTGRVVYEDESDYEYCESEDEDEDEDEDEEPKTVPESAPAPEPEQKTKNEDKSSELGSGEDDDEDDEDVWTLCCGENA